MFLPELEDVSFNTIADGESFALTDPNADIFNARAVNPTVEVYVGNCDEKDENGECLDGVITDGDGGSVKGYIDYKSSSKLDEYKIEFDTWQTFTVDISTFGDDCTEFAFVVASGNVIYLRDIVIK